MIFINDNDNDESVHPSMQKPVITIRINKENNTITLNVDPTTYSIGDDDPKFFAFIALKLLYHISLWDEEILKKLGIDTEYPYNLTYQYIIACINKFFKTGANFDILQLSAALPSDEVLKKSFLSVLNDVSTENVDSFIASITEAFTNPTHAAESVSSTDETASATKPSTQITLVKLTTIVIAAYDKANAQINGIGSRLAKEEFVKMSSTEQAKEIKVLAKANNALRDIITEISDAINSYKPENEDPISKLYNPAIEAITNAIDKVTAATSSSSPSSGAAAAAPDVKAATEAVNKTNYSGEVGYKQQLEADVSEVEKAADDNSLIKHLENLLHLVISKLDPKYEEAINLVDAAIKAADDAASNAEKAEKAQVAAEAAQAAAISAGATGAAAAAAAIATAAAAAAIATAALSRTTIKTEDAVSDATIYNHFFRTIKTLKKEYDGVNTACKKVKTSITDASHDSFNFRDLTINLKALKAALKALKVKFNPTEPEPEEEDSATFSLFDGGGSKTKTKSKSSSSHKSKSKSKNKTKNKTKKNHSHSDKRKIPKIKMN
jgi:hypothetical protein